MKDQFAGIVRRVLRYDFEDGTTEIMSGLVFWGAGMLFKPLPEPEIPPVFSTFIFVLSLFLIGWIKRRYVYPRSGYVKTVNFSGNRTTKFLRILFGLLIGLVLVAAIFNPIILFYGQEDSGFSWIAMTFGLVISLVFAIQGIRLGFPRLIVVALISAGVAIFFSPLVLNNQTYYFSTEQHPYWVVEAWQIFFPAYFLSMAPVLTFSGGLAFLNYLRRNPLLTEESNEQ